MIPIVWREWRALSRSLVTVLLHFLTPLFLLIFFATVLGRNLSAFEYHGQAVSYLDYFTPGLIGYLTFMSFQMSVTFVRHDRMSGMLGIIYLSSGGLGGYIRGKLLAQIAINVLKATFIVLLSLLISSGRIALFQPGNIGLFSVALLLGSAVWMSLGIALALVLRRDDLREVLMLIISMPIAFASTMYYDVSRAPSWIVALSNVNPLTYICNLAREAYLAESASVDSSDLLTLVAMSVLSLALAHVVSKRVSLCGS